MNDTVIFFVLAALALVFKWLTSKSSGDEDKPPASPPNEPIRRAPPPTEEERVRRFLEALGVPSGTQPPPPVRPRSAAPRPVATPTQGKPPLKAKRSWAQPLPPVVTTPKDTPFPPPTPAWQPEQTFVMEEQAASAADVPPPPLAKPAAPSAGKSAPIRAVPMMSLRPLLHSREKIRQAIILREILGPPLGLEPFGQFPRQ